MTTSGALLSGLGRVQPVEKFVIKETPGRIMVRIPKVGKVSAEQLGDDDWGHEQEQELAEQTGFDPREMWSVSYATIRSTLRGQGYGLALYLKLIELVDEKDGILVNDVFTETSIPAHGLWLGLKKYVRYWQRGTIRIHGEDVRWYSAGSVKPKYRTSES